MRRSTHLLGTLTLLLAAACAGDTLGPAAAPDAVLARGGTARPMGGECETAFTFLTPPGVNPAELRIDGVCRLRHLGRVTMTAHQRVTFVDAARNSVIANTAVYRAANGDELHSTFAGTGATPDATGSVRLDGTETYAGGTGRFAGASGSASLTGAASLPTATGRFTTSGTLSY